ncbi:MAG: AraC family transcriptional regulator, partial [Oscillospiraceae bacterium]
IYLFNIFTSLAIGVVLLGVKSIPRLTDKRYRRAKKYVGLAAILIAVGNAIVLSKGMASYSVDMFSIDILTLLGWQACLFTFSVITLFHSSFVTRRNVLINLAPTALFLVIYLIVYAINGDVEVRSFAEYAENISNPTLLLRTLFSIVLAVQYVNYIRIFRRERRFYIDKINNHFADTSDYELCWGSSIFYKAAFLGFSVLLLCIYSDPIADGILTFCVTLFYLDFAIRYINYQHTLFYALPTITKPSEEIAPIFEELLKNGKATEKETSIELVPSELGKKLEQLIKAKKPHLTHGLVISDLSRPLKVTDKQLSFYISNTYGVRFNKWINTLRIEHAKGVAKENPAISFDEIVEQSGFSDGSNFSRVFKQTTGITYKKFKNSLL